MMNNRFKGRTSAASAGIALEAPFAVWNVGREVDDGRDAGRLGDAILCTSIFRAYVTLAVIYSMFLAGVIFLNLRG